MHKDAFMLMIYEDEVNGRRELIWNSRDGVAPFIIRSKDGNTSRHVEWKLDYYLPNYVPPVGSQIFVDSTLEVMTLKATRYVEENWANPNDRMHQICSTPEEAVQFFALDWSKDPRMPTAVVVTPEIRQHFFNLKESRKPKFLKIEPPKKIKNPLKKSLPGRTPNYIKDEKWKQQK